MYSEVRVTPGGMRRLRSAAEEGRLTDERRAEARALAVARRAALAWPDLYFLASLNPGDDPFASAVPPSSYVPAGGPPPPADALAAGLRSKLDLDSHGDPIQAEGLDMAVRLLLASPTARRLAAEFVALDRKVKVSFEPLDGSGVYGEGAHKYVAGIGGLTSHLDGDRVEINAGYLSTDLRNQFQEVPGILAHELLGHVLNGLRAERAGASWPMGVWRGDEDLAATTGWLVQAEIEGKLPPDPYLWSYLSDPEGYHRSLQLVTKYYAETFTPDEAARAERVYAERLARVRRRVETLNSRLDPAEDWGKVLDHFQSVHGVSAARLASLRVDLVDSSSAAAKVELGRLLAIRDGLSADLKELKDPVRLSRQADLAKAMSAPFFADGERRLAAQTEKLRALAAGNSPFQTFPAPADALTWDDLRELYRKDRAEHPEHWAPAQATPTP